MLSPQEKCTRSASFVTLAFKLVGLRYEAYVVIDPLYTRPSEVSRSKGMGLRRQRNSDHAEKLTLINSWR